MLTSTAMPSLESSVTFCMHVCNKHSEKTSKCTGRRCKNCTLHPTDQQVCTNLEHLLAGFHCLLDVDWCLWRSRCLTQLSTTPLPCQIVLAEPRGVFWWSHWAQTRWGGVSLQDVAVALLLKTVLLWMLNKFPAVSPAKSPLPKSHTPLQLILCPSWCEAHMQMLSKPKSRFPPHLMCICWVYWPCFS